MAITETKLKNLYGKQGKECTIADGNSLSAVISPKGKISFQFRFRWLGKQARMKLGTYPAYSLNDARAAVLQCKRELDQGLDPRQQKQLNIEKNQSQLSVTDGLKYWLKDYAKANRTDHSNLETAFDAYVYKLVGEMPINAMDLKHWNKVFENPKLKQHPVQAGHILGAIKQAMRYLKKKGKADNLVLETLAVNDVGSTAKKGKRYLFDHELSKVWRYVNGDPTLELQNNKRPIGRRNILIVKLIMAFGDRTVELRTANKEDFDLDNGIWMIKDAKAGNTIIRPIHDSLIGNIQELKDMYPDTPVLIPPMDTPNSKEPVTGGSLSRIPERFNTRLGIEHWSMHDLRRTIQTHMLKLEIDEGVTEKVLGHVLTGTKANYNKHDYLKEQLAAYDVWLGHLDSLM